MTESHSFYPRLLTIAGSDSGGGAGIQADLKVFSALECFGMSVITAVTAQNTREVTAIHAIPCDVIAAQIDAVVMDIGVDAVKTGMLATPEVIHTVAQSLRRHNLNRVVVDPVMVAKSGDKLLRDDAVETLRKELLPLASVVTPNLPEAEVLLNRKIGDRNEMLKAAKELSILGPKFVVIKGGHLNESDSPDLLFDAQNGDHRWLNGERINSRNTHGTGCSFSSAIAAGLGHGMNCEEALQNAKLYISRSIAAAKMWKVGQGHGPVHHFHHFWRI